MYKRFLKRIIDIFGAIGLFVLFSPLFLIISLLLLLTNKGQIIYSQNRPGKNGETFTLYKLQTMREPLPEDLNETDRITWIGKILRKTSLDEFPQLVNVLKGDMSLIGPRPLLMEYLPLYSEFQMKRHDVLPGITGWAQVKGRNLINWDEKFGYDIYYVENLSFMLDLKILLLTPVKLFFTKEIYNENKQLVEKFKGNS